MNINDTVRTKLKLDLTDSQRTMIRERLDSSGDGSPPTALMVRIAATHAGMKNKNNAVYIPDKMRESTITWIEPHEKPVLLHHNKMSDPIGRVKNAEYIDLPHTSDSSKPLGYISVLAKVTDAAAIEKILDERYLTVSIGGTTDEVNCSICNKNIAEGGICEHKKGKVYDGKECYWKIGKMSYNELSFVNAPADEYASVESIETVDMVLEDSEVFLEEELEETVEGTETEEDNEMTDLESIMSYEFTDEEAQLLAGDLGDALDLEVGDAKLSTKKRKSLASSTFCGPNRSFPVPDCAHVTAARRLIGRAKGLSSGAKSRILSCVSRKAKSMGCDSKSKSDAENNEQLSVADVFAYWVADVEQAAVFEDNLIAKTEEFEVLVEQHKAMTTTLEDFTEKNKTLKQSNEDLQKELNDVKAEKERLLEQNASLITEKHRSLAERLVDMRITLRKPDMRDVFTATSSEDRKQLRDEKVEEFSKREVSALEYAINDLAVEVNDVGKPTEVVDSKAEVNDGTNGEFTVFGVKGQRRPSRKTRSEETSAHLGIKSRGK